MYVLACIDHPSLIIKLIAIGLNENLSKDSHYPSYLRDKRLDSPAITQQANKDNIFQCQNDLYALIRYDSFSSMPISAR